MCGCPRRSGPGRQRHAMDVLLRQPQTPTHTGQLQMAHPGSPAASQASLASMHTPGSAYAASPAADGLTAQCAQTSVPCRLSCLDVCPTPCMQGVCLQPRCAAKLPAAQSTSCGRRRRLHRQLSWSSSCLRARCCASALHASSCILTMLRMFALRCSQVARKEEQRSTLEAQLRRERAEFTSQASAEPRLGTFPIFPPYYTASIGKL